MGNINHFLCDEPLADSLFCNQNVACALIGVNTRILHGFTLNGDLDPPQIYLAYGCRRKLFNRAQVMKLAAILQLKTSYLYQRRNGSVDEIMARMRRRFRLRIDECSIPSTWWYQARSIADTSHAQEIAHRTVKWRRSQHG